ncbi:MAG: hypothetical protein CL557_17500 [Alphaproteobacteria bacterium]|nr:hypothetical protein [Alphaproteobacteria bacterium]|tara:strand:+ start:1498 stop:2490 length:993 start_codon:yes stop_codon:yes gene_type:complete
MVLEFLATPGGAALAGGVLNFAGGLFGRSSASKQRNAEKEALRKRYEEYDLPGWEMTGERMIADRDHLIDQINLRQQNEKDRAAFTDKNNLRNWEQSLKIRDYKIDQNKRLYEKSEELYLSALGLNRESAMSAREQTLIAQRETEQQLSFQNESNIIASIIAKGEAAAKTQTGKSALKQAQSLLADVGRNQAILTESLFSAGTSTRMQLMDIDREYRAANTKAYANRMLEPEAPPIPLKPLETPLSKYILPREFIDADFGPKPIMGVPTTQVPSMMGVLAGAAAAGFDAYTNNYTGNVTENIGGASTHNFGSLSMSDAMNMNPITYPYFN